MGRPPAGKIQTWLHAQVEAATRDTLEEEAVMDWQPIETAPKDGTWFLAFQSGEIYPCEFQEDEDDGDGRLAAGGWLDLFNGTVEHPTHWMPRPKPPATTQEHGTTPRHNMAQHPDEDDS